MSLRVILAGGGTGGHVFPLLAVASALDELAPDYRVLFVGTRRGMESTLVPARQRSIEFLDIQPIRGRGLVGALRGATRAMAVMPEASRLLQRELPNVVLSVGGYAAGPVTLAAWMRGIPTALIEPNSAMGLANLCVAKIVDRAYTAFAEVESKFGASRVLRTGVPLRPGFDPRPLVAHDKGMRILVLGGSQGALALNELLPRVIRELPETIEILHQCGEKHAEGVARAYGDLRPPRIRVVPFIEDMPGAIAWADVVISRSGASAVSEICGIGRPSILIPYPYAAGAHQLKNARALHALGAAICIEPDAVNLEKLRECLLGLLGNRERLQQMSEAAASWGRPQAARDIAQDLIRLAQSQQGDAGSGRVSDAP